jgi:hypothetical protein
VRDSNEPKIVSKRNHFESCVLMVEDHLRFLPKELQTDELKAWLVQYTEHVVSRVSNDFATAARQGIEQAAELIRDPEYFMTLKKRRASAIRRNADYQEQQDAARKQRHTSPTPDQIEFDLKECDRWIQLLRCGNC